jgi:uncharacterized protein with PQ loop repeat
MGLVADTLFCDIAQALGWAATFLFSVALIPQIKKTAQTKTVEGVSSWTFIINLVANIIALAYAIMISQGPLVIKYVIALALTAGYLVLYAVTSKDPSTDKPSARR